MIPCISVKDINYLYGTADERYNFSKEFFRKTHFPQSLNRYYNNNVIEKLLDKDLLNELKNSHPIGNRVYIIFGSTGSGKSELLCWLRDQWVSENNSRPIIRISRNELNPQVLIKKCYDSIGLELEELIIDENKWNLLIDKPITIINQIVWTVMSEFFDKDENIIPTTMIIRPIIEKNILEFTKQIIKGEIIKPLEIITKKEFDTLKESTSIEINIDYYKFRNALLQKLDQFLFNGTDIKTLFIQLSKVLVKRKIRPVLLIDDLVQSINLYAADLLDYFITLEEGNWDVVIGLTPGAEQGQDFNVELIKRIKTLDTIDDRVKKVWLSDEAGSNFFTLAREQVEQYLMNYLITLKEANGFNCSNSCPHSNVCGNFFEETDSDNRLLPLNKVLIDRIYNGIPNGKGKLRYLILNTREILQSLIKGDNRSIKKVINLIDREVYIEHEDEIIKFLAEIYAPGDKNEFMITKELLQHFKQGMSIVNGQDVKITRIEKHEGNQLENEKVLFKQNKFVNHHIRDWVEGKKVKEQLLEPIRSGVATIVHEVVKASSMVKDNTSRSIKVGPTIQRSEIINRHKYPIGFTTSDSNQIVIERKINLLKVADFQQLKMQERGNVFSTIADDANLSKWIYQTENLKKQWIYNLEKFLGFSLGEFAFYFKQLILQVYSLGQTNILNDILNPIKKEWLELSEELFMDWFALRDNMIDSNELEKLDCQKEFNYYFLNFTPRKELNQYHIKNIPFQYFILEIQNEINTYLELLKPILLNKGREIYSYKRYHRILPNDLINKIYDINAIFIKETFSLDDYTQANRLINAFFEQETHELISRIKEEQTLIIRLHQFLSLIERGDGTAIKIDNLSQLDGYLKDHLGVRSYVRKHILNILKSGVTELPRKQWKGILSDIEKINPEFFDNISVSINLRK
ncbi:hypothetical protein [Bacillus infantis]|uniref:hypothetical protein n=1 Tax=Bacillus infantis TaxID=324767 RepID=UPI003CEBEE52